MSTYKKKKHFIKKPQYPGGKQAFIQFIKKHLRYPEEALAAKIEGRVLVGFDVDDNGQVHNPHIIKGIGHGCDDEALRVVRFLQYEKVKNRGIRIRAKHKTYITFRLPKASIAYEITKEKKKVPEKNAQPAQSTSETTYNYTITFDT